VEAKTDVFTVLTVHADSVNFTSFNNFKSAITIILIIARPRQRGANAGMNVAIVGEQAFLRSVIEICTMIDTGLLGRSTSEYFWLPCITISCQKDSDYSGYCKTHTDGCQSV
jgi:hypothetical protein